MTMKWEVTAMFLIAELVVLLTTNLILTQALGTSTLFIAAGSKKIFSGRL